VLVAAAFCNSPGSTLLLRLEGITFRISSY
jgi:hypothetical protein